MAEHRARGEGVERRTFVKLCASAVIGVAASPDVLAGGTGIGRDYDAATLLSDVHSGRPLRAADVPVGEALVFHYPYRTTPCFLLNLGRPIDGDDTLRTQDGAGYRWPGGVGANRSIVAFAAICQHKMTHPARSVSFIDYHHERVTFRGADRELVERDGVIYCCSERSVYDPAAGARVLGGPARQPLTAIALEHDEGSDALRATGTRGAELYDRFFEQFEHRLMLEYETERVREPVTGGTGVMRLAEFSAKLRQCG